MGTQTIKIDAAGNVDATDPSLHISSNSGNNQVKWKSKSGTHTVSNLPDVFTVSPPPASLSVAEGQYTETLTVRANAQTGNYTYQVDDGEVATAGGLVGGGSKPEIKVQP